MDLHLLSPVPGSSPVPQRGRISGAAAVSMAAHLSLAAVLIWFTYAHVQHGKEQPQDDTPQRVVWVAMPGPSGGGGGSPVVTLPPPRPTPAQATKADTAPTVIPTEIISAPAPVEPQPPVAVVADAAASGAAVTPATAPGTGKGNGSGPGDGDGVGPGKDKGFGGGAYRPGNDVTSPFPTYRAQPQYTSEAMRARAQGVITVECVVEPNGACGDVRIAQAFSPPYGLDQQALAAARRWKFRPGTRAGEPVPVLVNLAIEFNIR